MRHLERRDNVVYLQGRRKRNSEAARRRAKANAAAHDGKVRIKGVAHVLCKRCGREQRVPRWKLERRKAFCCKCHAKLGGRPTPAAPSRKPGSWIPLPEVNAQGNRSEGAPPSEGAHTTEGSCELVRDAETHRRAVDHVVVAAADPCRT